MKKQSPLNEKELALRKWCIDCAIKWPWSASRGYQGLSASIPPYSQAEAPDIIARATLIYNWVTKKDDK